MTYTFLQVYENRVLLNILLSVKLKNQLTVLTFQVFQVFLLSVLLLQSHIEIILSVHILVTLKKHHKIYFNVIVWKFENETLWHCHILICDFHYDGNTYYLPKHLNAFLIWKLTKIKLNFSSSKILPVLYLPRSKGITTGNDSEMSKFSIYLYSKSTSFIYFLINRFSSV